MDGDSRPDMNYRETLEYLFSRLPMYQRIGKAAYKADLSTTIAIDKYFNHPHRLFKSIHIAGTNGKGSVSHMLAGILQQAGYRTGLYTSPHLKDFRERIRINGQPVEKDFVVDFVASHRQVLEELSPSFFEMSVAMAFDYFARERVDIAVVETGMGGRLDSTNIITPLVSVITNIGMDHMEFLGDSLPLIAAEKAGIIKPGIPVVIGELQEEIREVFQEKAREVKAGEVTFASEAYKCEYAMLTSRGRQSMSISRQGRPAYKDLETDLQGIYQQKNVVTVLQTVDILNRSGLAINRDSVYGGLGNAGDKTGLHGRWQIAGANPRVIYDTAHNREGLRMVLQQIGITPHKKLHMVIGFVSDKNIRELLSLFPSGATYYFTRASIPRALDDGELQKMAQEAGLSGNRYGTVPEALRAAKQNAGTDDLIFVGGSTFVVADIL
jgi:dihydrofolate synthase / folylpolyglutamate synthase